MNSVTLYDEYRLIERPEIGINRAWQGAHLLLFFLAFVFGSFCTFCFHMLMYLFDEKCVLFPKLQSLTSMRHNVIYEFIPADKDLSDLPVDFLSTQWVEKSTCVLPTYVPLISGIFGLVWTTMFLMCSTGSRNLTGLQRPWRVLPPVFLFSVAMSGLCIYSSAITHYGLQELCIRLGEITGSSTCSYTVNVATLTYERRIRGVYQATRLTITSAWLHTACWLASALLAIVRVLLAVDFQLVRVRAALYSDIDKIMEKNETQIRSISPDDIWINEHYTSTSDDSDFSSKTNTPKILNNELTPIHVKSSHILFLKESNLSDLSLVPAEKHKLDRISAYEKVPQDKQFIVKMLFDLIDHLELRGSLLTPIITPISGNSTISPEASKPIEIVRQYGRQEIGFHPDHSDSQKHTQSDSYASSDSDVIARYVRRELKDRLRRMLMEVPIPATTTRTLSLDNRSVDTMTREMRKIMEQRHRKIKTKAEKTKRGSNIKNVSTQTDTDKKEKSRKSTDKHVFISELNSMTDDTATDQPRGSKKLEVDKETQTQKKEKQD